MYAIAFDLDTKMLELHYPGGGDGTGAYGVIERVLEKRGFRRRQGSLFFGDAKTTPVHCFLAVSELSKNHPWFRVCVKDIRMLRIEENNDLMPIVEEPAFEFGNPAAVAAE